jgi:TRAP-type C4-dicarboxylate transport system permease small subunit
MNEAFDKWDIHNLKNTTSLRYFGQLCIIIFAAWTIYCFYSAFISNHIYSVKSLNRVMFYALFVTLGMSCLIYSLNRTIEKLKNCFKSELSSLIDVHPKKNL